MRSLFRATLWILPWLLPPVLTILAGLLLIAAGAEKAVLFAPMFSAPITIMGFFLIPHSRTTAEPVSNGGSLLGMNWVESGKERYIVDELPPFPTAKPKRRPDGWSLSLGEPNKPRLKASCWKATIVTFLCLCATTLLLSPPTNLLVPLATLMMVFSAVPHLVAFLALKWLQASYHVGSVERKGHILTYGDERFHLSNAGTTRTLSRDIWGTMLQLTNRTESLRIRGPAPALQWLAEHIQLVDDKEAQQIPDALKNLKAIER